MLVLGCCLTALAALFALAGAMKLREPGPTGAAAAATGWASGRLLGRHRWGVRVLGAVEVVVGVWCLVGGGRFAWVLLAIGFAVFTVVCARLLRAAPGTECGCFGAAASTMHPVHVAVNAVGAAVALTAVVVSPPGPVAIAAVLSPAQIVGAASLVLALTGIGYLCYTALPDLLSARQILEVPS